MPAPIIDLTGDRLGALATLAAAQAPAQLIDVTASSASSAPARPGATTSRGLSVMALLNDPPVQEAPAAAGSKRKKSEASSMQPPPKRPATDAAPTAQAGERSTTAPTVPLTEGALAALDRTRQPARTARSARAAAPLPSAASIMRFHQVPPGQRVREFGRLAAAISAAISPSAVLTDTKEKMCQAVLDLAGQAQYLKSGNERVEAFKLIDGLVRRLPPLDGQPATEFHGEYARLRHQLLPPNFANLNRSFGTGSA